MKKKGEEERKTHNINKNRQNLKEEGEGKHLDSWVMEINTKAISFSSKNISLYAVYYFLRIIYFY